MALTPLRWIALAVAGALIVTTLVLRPDSESARTVEPRQIVATRASMLTLAAGRGAERVWALHLRDSVRVALGRMPATDTSRMFIDRAVQTVFGDALVNLTRRSLDYRPARPAAPVDIVFVLDTVRTVRGVARSGGNMLAATYNIPSGPTERCLVLVHVRPQPEAVAGSLRRYASWAFTRGNYARQLLGPCGFVERFGVPGAGVDRWLSNGAWVFGRQIAWDRPAAVWTSPWRSYGVSVELGTGWPLRDYVTAEGYRCVSGDAATCERMLVERLSRTPRSDIDVLPGPRIVYVRSLSAYLEWYRRRFGPVENRLLSDMVRSLGPDRFRQFWTSPLPITDAFRGAAGRDLGDWVTEWATQAYGETGRGPAVPPTGYVLALALVAMSAVGAGMAAKRRQVR